MALIHTMYICKMLVILCSRVSFVHTWHNPEHIISDIQIRFIIAERCCAMQMPEDVDFKCKIDNGHVTDSPSDWPNSLCRERDLPWAKTNAALSC